MGMLKTSIADAFRTCAIGPIRQTGPIGLFERSQTRDPEIADGPADPGGE